MTNPEFGSDNPVGHYESFADMQTVAHERLADAVLLGLLCREQIGPTYIYFSVGTSPEHNMPMAYFTLTDDLQKHSRGVGRLVELQVPIVEIDTQMPSPRALTDPFFVVDMINGPQRIRRVMTENSPVEDEEIFDILQNYQIVERGIVNNSY